MNQLGPFINNHWGLFIALLIIIVLIIINETIMRSKRSKEISPAKTIELINQENAAIIDIRDEETFRAGHIINAVRSTEEDLIKKSSAKYKNKPLVLVCAKGLSSSQLAVKLSAAGYQQVMVLAGGMNAWLADNLPVVKGK